MRCLVLGGSGFIGRCVVRQLLDKGEQPIVADLRVDAFPDGRIADLKDPESLTQAVTDVDCVVHLAWASAPASSTANPIDDVHQNVLGSLHLFASCVARGVRRVVFCSTGGAIYGQPRRLPVSEDHPTVPISSYGVTKLATEAYLRMFAHLHGLEYVILRPGNAYGEGQRSNRNQGVVAGVLDAIARQAPFQVWGDGSVVRDYVHVDDIARAIVLATVGAKQGVTLNVGTGRGHSVNEIIKLAENITGRSVEVHYRPSRLIDVHDNVLDCAAAAECLDWRPNIALAEGMARQWQSVVAESPGHEE